jgi:hypothetical protein
MNTFLPYPNFKLSAQSLDRQRLGKQRVEVFQLLKAICADGGWKNHPCTKMWSQHTNALVEYGIAVCDEWIGRGYKDTTREKIASFYNPNLTNDYPPFIGKEDFHIRHRSMLIQKKPEYYKDQFPNTPEGLEYIWG